MKSIDVSIVIPVYNAASFLDKCVACIVSQKTTLQYEAIFVNDGSTDYSRDILKKWESQSKIIHVVDKVNAGPSAARNTGIDVAKGKYVLFVDSDDWVSEHYVEDFRKYIDNPGCGIVIQGFYGISKKGREIRSFEDRFFRKKEIVSFFEAYPIHHNGVPFAKLYNLLVVKKHNLRFCDHVRFGEDLIFLLDYLYLCDWIAFDDHVNYFYRRLQDGSLVVSYNSFESEFLGYRKLKEAFAALESCFSFSKVILDEFHRWIYFFAMRTIKTIYREGPNFMPRKDRLKLLKSSFEEQDFIFFKSCSYQLKGLDKYIGILMCKRKFFFIDCFLRMFFIIRYNVLVKKIIKKMIGNIANNGRT